VATTWDVNPDLLAGRCCGRRPAIANKLSHHRLVDGWGIHQALGAVWLAIFWTARLRDAYASPAWPEVTALALKAAPSEYVASLFKLQGGERTS
jgi:hypothetical protein